MFLLKAEPPLGGSLKKFLRLRELKLSTSGNIIITNVLLGTETHNIHYRLDTLRNDPPWG